MSIRKSIITLTRGFYSTVSQNIRTPLKKRRPPISVTTSAADRLSTLISECQSNDPVLGIRLGVKKRGCNGLSYTMNYIHTTADDLKKVENDEVVVCDNNIKVFVELKAILSIVGTTMDYVDTDLKSEFTFINQLSKGECGCGESFTT